MNIDSIVVGAGFAGIVMAERLARIAKKAVLLIEQRNHIGGNCYDCYDDHHILIQKYGPHIFHTDSQEVWQYLSQFTDWYFYEHRVLARIDGIEVPIPFNLNTLAALLPSGMASRIEEKLIAYFGFGTRLPLRMLWESGDRDLCLLADFVHEKVFINYTVKHWGMRPEDMAQEVSERVPIVVSKDDRYFPDRYQGLPRFGFTRMFEKMLNLPQIKLLLNTPMQEVVKVDIEDGTIKFMGSPFRGELVFTGMIDQLLDYRYGELPYRTLRFDWETLNKTRHQDAAVINYPNNYDFTRVTEFKHLTGQTHHKTTILREYPCQYQKDHLEKNIPYYPIFTKQNKTVAEKYIHLIDIFNNITLIGRLAEYKYYDMDDMVERALTVFKNNFIK